MTTITNTAKAMAGLQLIGSVMDATEDNVRLLPFILAGQYDEELKQAGLLAHGSELKAELFIVRFKDTIRSFISGIFKEAERQEMTEQAKQLAELKERLKLTNKPHELGTVDEIAKRFGISKSEVRRRKAAGTLHELQEIKHA